MRILRLHLGLVLLLPMTIVPVGKLSAGERHAGIVLSVAADSLVIDELGRAGKAHQLRVTVTPRTRIILSQRDPQELEFTDTPISLAQVKKGDFVYLPPWCVHGIENTGTETLVVLIATSPPNP